MKNNSSESLRRVLRHLKPYTGWIILALLCAAGNVAATLYIPILVGKAVDAIVGPGQVVFAAVASIGLEIAVLALLGAAAQNKAEWDEKALLRLERILKMDDCRAAAELSACANRAKTRLKKSAALLAMR